ncbi:MAG: hypothetical protein AAB036_01260 [Elusimicrobiota bacterium]
MKIPLLALSLLLGVLSSASAMSPKVEAFLQRVGIDPRSEEARIADSDGVIETTYRGDSVKHSLESLVAENKPNGVRCFVTTRAFIKNLRADFKGTEIPAEYYDALYLTKDERQLVGRKIADGVAGD